MPKEEVDQKNIDRSKWVETSNQMKRKHKMVALGKREKSHCQTKCKDLRINVKNSPRSNYNHSLMGMEMHILNNYS